MRQNRLDDYPELRAAVRDAERIQAALRAALRLKKDAERIQAAFRGGK